MNNPINHITVNNDELFKIKYALSEQEQALKTIIIHLNGFTADTQELVNFQERFLEAVKSIDRIQTHVHKETVQWEVLFQKTLEFQQKHYPEVIASAKRTIGELSQFYSWQNTTLSDTRQLLDTFKKALDTSLSKLPTQQLEKMNGSITELENVLLPPLLSLRNSQNKILDYLTEHLNRLSLSLDSLQDDHLKNQELVKLEFDKTQYKLDAYTDQHVLMLKDLQKTITSLTNNFKSHEQKSIKLQYGIIAMVVCLMLLVLLK